MTGPRCNACDDTERLDEIEWFGCMTGDCPHQTQAECDIAILVVVRSVIAERRAAPTPEASAPRCPTCGAAATRIWHLPEGDRCISSDCVGEAQASGWVHVWTVRRPAAPAREASSAPGWDRAVDVADEFVAALAVRNRGSGTEGPRTHTDAYAAWLHLTQVLAASRATVAALIARATFTEQERANYEQAIEALQDRVAALTADRDHWKSLANAIAGQHDRALDALTAERGARGQGQD